MMCAAVAGQRGRRVLLIEHYDKLGEKIRISGGGRCNFTNLHAEPANYLSQNPDFCRSALSRYTPRDFIELVERYGIAWHEKTLGQLFCDGHSLDIIAMLKTECDRAGVQWRMPCAVRGRHARRRRLRGVDRDGTGARRSAGHRDRRLDGAEDRRDAVRLSYRRAVRHRGRAAAAGAGAAGVRSGGAGALRRPFGRLRRRRGVLQRRQVSRERCCSPIAVFPARRSFRSRRTGTAATRCRSTCCRAATRVRGWRASAGRRRDWTTSSRTACRGASRSNGARRTALRVPVSAARRQAPARAGEPAACLAGAAVGHARLQQGRSHAGRRRYARAVVEDDGSDATCRGLHFIGEVVDVTGWLGGYNFQWAWSSGYAAGQHA